MLKDPKVLLIVPLLSSNGLHIRRVMSKKEFLAELSHIPLAILAVMAGWSRWLEIRLPVNQTRPFGRIWPVCFIVIGAVLLFYRES
jgi:putative copper resistance protein D